MNSTNDPVFSTSMNAPRPLQPGRSLASELNAAEAAPSPADEAELTVEDRLLAAELEVEFLKQQAAARDAADAQVEADEELIEKKMAVGLSRPQAEAVIRRQREFDKLEETERPKREAERARRRAAHAAFRNALVEYGGALA